MGCKANGANVELMGTELTVANSADDDYNANKEQHFRELVVILYNLLYITNCAHAGTYRYAAHSFLPLHYDYCICPPFVV